MPDTLHELEQTLLSRQAARPAGSYSAELFADPERIQRKIMEEAFEVCLELSRPTTDLVAIHLVVPAPAFWAQLAKLRELGASGIVALRPDALLPR